MLGKTDELDYWRTVADFQPNRTHPADFENPGRVKVQFQKDGKFLNPIIKNRTSISPFILFHYPHYLHFSPRIGPLFKERSYNEGG
jgi:hypothetical protein